LAEAFGANAHPSSEHFLKLELTYPTPGGEGLHRWRGMGIFREVIQGLFHGLVCGVIYNIIWSHGLKVDCLMRKENPFLTISVISIISSIVGTLACKA
ncbi:MAG: hypothetical protein ACKVKR_07455, partial [Pseudomonadales bacterium]